MFKTIKAKILASQILIIFLLVGILGPFSYFLFIRSLKKSQKNSLEYFTQDHAFHLKSHIQEKEQRLETIANGEPIEDYTQYFRYVHLTEYFSHFLDEFADLAYYNENGVKEVEINRNEKIIQPADISQTTLFQDAIWEPNKVFMSFAAHPEDSSKMALTFAICRRNFFDEFLGIITGWVPVPDMICEIQGHRVGESGFLMLLDDQGTLLCHPQNELRFRRIEVSGRQSDAILSEILAMKTGFGRATIFDMDGFVAYAPVEGMNWALIALLPYKEFMKAPNRLRNTFIGFAFAILGLGILLPLIVARGITHPIHNLVEITSAIAKGDLSRRIEIRSDDEIAILGRSFNRMTEDLKKSRDDLIAEKQRLGVTLLSIEDGVIATNAKEEVILINKIAEDLTGRSQMDALGKPLSDVFHILDAATRQKMENPVKEVLRTGEIVHLRDGTGIISGDGMMKRIEDSAAPIRDSNGKILGAVLVFRDITEKLKSEENYRSVVENSNDGICIMQDERVKFCNQRQIELTGYSAEEIIDTSFTRYIVTDELKKNRKHYERFMRGKEDALRFETALIHKTGRTIDVEVSVSAVHYEGRRAALVFTRDITHRKKMEEKLHHTLKDLERSNAELAEFAYVASHDLQEPLRMVASYVQLLESRYKGKLDADADEFIGFAVDGADRMQRLIQDLLKYSRVGTHGQPFEMNDCRIIFQEVLVNLRKSIEESGAVISHDPLPIIMSDASQINQLFQNLISNAIKYRGKEPPRIHISAQKNNNHWLFSVGDNGIGIEPDYTEHIFKIFQRLQNAREFPGNGIGLAICKKIVERHNGHIWVESEPAKGSKFYFTIPNEKERRHEC
ncbi:MAG: PAS domain S-box protein [bacterium]